MHEKVGDMFHCFYCREAYETKKESEESWNSHHIVLLPLAEEDLNRLRNFNFSHDDKLLTTEITRMIQIYSAKAAERQWQRNL